MASSTPKPYVPKNYPSVPDDSAHKRFVTGELKSVSDSVNTLAATAAQTTATVALKADKTYVDSQDAATTASLALKADTTYVNSQVATLQPLLGFTPVNKAGDTMSGGLGLGAPLSFKYIGLANLDCTPATVTVANGAVCLVIQNFSGVVILNNWVTGACDAFICGGGSAPTRFGTSNGGGHFGGGYSAPDNGYFFTNTSGSTATIAACVIRTRTGA